MEENEPLPELGLIEIVVEHRNEPALGTRMTRLERISRAATESNMGIHPPNQWEIFAGLLVMCVTVAISVFIELLGWRIITPGLSLPDAWNHAFLAGVFRTVGGATLLGVVVVIPGVMLRPTRSWNLANLLLLWSIGAGIFLLAMTALLAWAP